MIIDHSMFSTFWRNPEDCRLEYVLNIVPKKKPAYWIAGGLFSQAVYLNWTKKSDSQIRSLITTAAAKEYSLKGDEQKKMVDKVMRWYNAFVVHRLNVAYKKIDAERQFKFDLPSILFEGLTHTAVGAMDEVLEYDHHPAVAENKTENNRSRTDHTYRWKHDTQASFYALALCDGHPEMIKHNTQIFVTVVKDLTPTRVFPFQSERTPSQLAMFKRQLAMTADTITMYTDYFGADKPWPHLINSYPCSFGNCQMESICNREHPPDVVIKRDFRKRIEHLSSVKTDRIKASC